MFLINQICDLLSEFQPEWVEEYLRQSSWDTEAHLFMSHI